MYYYYIRKYLIHLLNILLFKSMVVEMLLNSNINKKIIKMILHFQKEISVIVYIIQNKI
jgi:hypothetical protein